MGKFVSAAGQWSNLDGILEAGEIAGAALGVVEVGKEDLLLLLGIRGSAKFSRLIKTWLQKVERVEDS